MTDTTTIRTGLRGRTSLRSLAGKLGGETHQEELTGSPRQRFLRHVVLIGLGVVMIYPLLWMLSASFKPSDMVFNDAGLIPSEVELRKLRAGLGCPGVPVPAVHVELAPPGRPQHHRQPAVVLPRGVRLRATAVPRSQGCCSRRCSARCCSPLTSC